MSFCFWWKVSCQSHHFFPLRYVSSASGWFQDFLFVFAFQYLDHNVLDWGFFVSCFSLLTLLNLWGDFFINVEGIHGHCLSNIPTVLFSPPSSSMIPNTYILDYLIVIFQILYTVLFFIFCLYWSVFTFINLIQYFLCLLINPPKEFYLYHFFPIISSIAI